ncbi:MAG: DDE-type integrase/transposase/recombinase [Myxacorys californica WJT36-NPBG1]|jgi:hypothetical protein|nr:DDE-type integrase/transposase/recombinase [Myxacorys californica WJT36-NPBG1]
MHNYLFTNDLIEWKNSSDNSLIERVLWIDEGYVIAFVFDINARLGFPQTRRVSEILEALSEGSAIKLPNDPWVRIVREADLTDREKEHRAKAWEIISSLVAQEPEIYYRDFRGSSVKQVVENYNIGRHEDKLIEKTVYKYLRRFWQRGKTENALIPDYVNSSGKGKNKGCGEKKRGRPKKHNQDPDIREGVNVTEKDRKIFRIAVAKYYNTPKRNSLISAYEQMIKEYYREEIRYDQNGVMKSILKPIYERPTLSQFRYWYQLEHQVDVAKTITSRKGAKKFALEHRAITGTSRMETIGPGSRYQIDATIADVYLVSKYNRTWIIGRPVIYVVIDVFSRMVVGAYVGLEGPSWVGAMMALVNAATDKVRFCKEYGIEITEEDWLCHHLPDAILGDRGELLGMPIEKNFIPNLHVRIENAAAYRADWKGLVERYFSIIHGHVKPFLPGYVDVDFRQRGAHDYRLDSRLDIEQFTEIIIRIILFYNNHHHLNTYERDEAMIADDVLCTPVELWKWGIANRSGRLKTFSEDIVKLNLMPTEKAAITAKGIKLKGKEMYYICDRAIKEQWFERARSGFLSASEKSLTVTYDVRNPNFIYLPSSDGRSFEKCFLTGSSERYANKNFYDIEYMIAYEKLQNQKNQGKELQEKVDLVAHIEDVVTRAETMTGNVLDNNLTDRQRISGIRDNRSSEKTERWAVEGFELAKTENNQGRELSVDSKSEALEQPKSLQPDHLDLLKQKLLGNYQVLDNFVTGMRRSGMSPKLCLLVKANVAITYVIVRF